MSTAQSTAMGTWTVFLTLLMKRALGTQLKKPEKAVRAAARYMSRSAGGCCGRRARDLLGCKRRLARARTFLGRDAL